MTTKKRKRPHKVPSFIRLLRLNAGLTQLELANAIGVTPQFICNIELSGKAPFPPTKMRKAAKTLGVTLPKFVELQVQEYRNDLKRKLGMIK